MLLSGGGGGSRIAHHFRECDHHCFRPLGFRIRSSTISRLSSPPSPHNRFCGSVLRHRLQRRGMSSASILHSKSSGGIPDCFSQREDDHKLSSEELSSVAGGIVALGKFDALHIGHRELVVQASKVGVPFLLSFVGMAEVLGWEPRAPIVAKCDRKRVLHSWAPYCGDVAPKEFEINFSSVRHLSPRLFVEKLSKELGVCGVVAGENYRFGYKAAGDASELVRLCSEYGVGAYIIKSVMDKNQDLKDLGSGPIDKKERGQVSSTRVRHALAVGDMKYVSELLGRNHRLILMAKDLEGLRMRSESSKHIVTVPRSWLLNLAPKEGLYEECGVFWGGEKNEEVKTSCRVEIERREIHMEVDEMESICNFFDNPQEMPLLGIEFGHLEVGDCV